LHPGDAARKLAFERRSSGGSHGCCARCHADERIAAMSRTTNRWASLIVLVLASMGAAAVPGAAADREFGDVEVFARVGAPGQPEGIVVGPDGSVYVSTNNRGKGDAEAASRIFRYRPDGTLDREYVVEGQADGLHGVLGLAFDGDARLYALDYAPARVLRIDPGSGEQETYATIPDLPRCADVADASCEPTTQDQQPWPNWPVFDAHGNLYVTDLHQATIWRIPPGSEAEVWHQSPDYGSVFSLNGQQFDADGDLVFVLTGSLQPGSPARGHVYRLEVEADGSPGERELLFQTLPGEGPDGMAIGASGHIYVALVTTHQVLVVGPGGSEVARLPGPVENQQQEIPFDSPASIAFRGSSILVTNHAYFTENPDSWAVLDVEVEEPGLPLHHPHVAASGDAAPAPVGPHPTTDDHGPDGRPLPATGGPGTVVLAILLLSAGAFARRRGP
jgi:sugar lactone lactonase YvrE